MAGWRRRPWVAIIETTGVMWLGVLVSGAADPHQDGLFIIGAFVVAGHTFTLVGLVALVADGLAGRKSSGMASPGWYRRPWVWIVMTAMVILNILFWL